MDRANGSAANRNHFIGCNNAVRSGRYRRAIDRKIAHRLAGIAGGVLDLKKARVEVAVVRIGNRGSRAGVDLPSRCCANVEVGGVGQVGEGGGVIDRCRHHGGGVIRHRRGNAIVDADGKSRGFGRAHRHTVIRGIKNELADSSLQGCGCSCGVGVGQASVSRGET